MKLFSLSVLESFNRFLNLVVGVAAITGLVGMLDYFNQHASVTCDLMSPTSSWTTVWVNESALIRYYKDHSYEMPDAVVRYLQRDSRVEIPDLGKAEAGEFSQYPEELAPDAPFYEHFQVQEKLRLESYSPFFGLIIAPAYPSNCDEWIDQILPEVRKRSETDRRILELAILSARRVESTIWLKNDGDLAATNIKVQISAVTNLVSGGKGSILAIRSLRPIPTPMISDYRAELVMPILEPKRGNHLTVITREAPIFEGNIAINYDTLRVVRSGKLAAVFLILLGASLGIVIVFSKFS
jgi:hypothetical protein